MTTPRAALLLALALAGCTKLLDTATLDPLGSAGGYCRARYDAQYARSVRCQGVDPGWAGIRPRFWYQEDCARTEVSVAAGRMTYDRAAGEACLAAYADPACGDPRASTAACAAAVAPAVAQGGECSREVECLRPGTCASPDGTCPGRCVGFGGLGDACGGLLGPCGPGLLCGAAGTCEARKASGQACQGDCLENLSCDAGFCTYVAGPGEACGVRACDPSLALACSGGVCLPPPGLGEACGAGGLCGPGLFCNQGQSVCLTLPTVALADGQPCPSPYFCGPASFCDPSLPTPACAPRKALGAACRGADDCLRPAQCDTSGPPASWACRPPAVAGRPCVPGGCATGAWCHVTTGTAGTCVTEPDLGQACGLVGIGDQASCVLGHCALASPGDLVGQCQPDRQAGEPCRQDVECSSFSCDPVASTCRPATCPFP